MNEPAPAQAMEDILASIKRIITDEATASPRAGWPAATPASRPDDNVLELGQPAPPPTDTLLSEPARAASRQLLGQLAGMRVDPNAADNTLDGLVRELLRPMLKDWLDAHLPDVVERIVAREVARLAGR